jgi:type IV secretion system protein VirB3
MNHAPDPLFVACTRPTMKWGVPFEGYCANVAMTTIFTTGIMGNPLYFSVGVVVHFVMKEKAARDPHFFHLWWLFFSTKMRSMTGHIWGGSRLQPAPAFATKASDMAVSL